MKEKNSKETNIYLFIFLFTVLNGALRKWVIPSKAVGNIVLLIQLTAPFFFFLSKKRFSPFKYRFFTLYFIYLICAASNPMNLTLIHGVLGILIHLGFWYAAFFYIDNRNLFNLEKVVKIIMIAAVAEILLAYVQYGLPSSNILNKYADAEAVGGEIASVGNAVRVTGTFSYISGFTSFILMISFVVWLLIKENYKAYITIPFLLFGLIAATMSGSRSCTYLYLIFTLFTMIFEFKAENIKQIFLGIAIPVILVAMVILSVGKIGIEDRITAAFDNFNERRESLQKKGEESSRIFWDLEQLVNFNGKYPIFGVGLGGTYQGATATFGTSEYVQEFGYYETENTRAVLEGGFILLFFRISLIIYFCSKLVVPLPAKFFFSFLLLFLIPIIYNTYNGTFFILGVILIDSFYYRNVELNTRKILTTT